MGKKSFRGCAPFESLTSLRASPFYACGVYKFEWLKPFLANAVWMASLFEGFSLRRKILRLYNVGWCDSLILCLDLLQKNLILCLDLLQRDADLCLDLLQCNADLCLDLLQNFLILCLDLCRIFSKYESYIVVC